MTELYKKYRPKSLSDMIGQDVAVKTLQAAAEKNRIPHFILFTGPSGCGKTTFARILRKLLHCSKHDFIEDAPRKIEDVRLIKRRINQAPMKGKCRIWLIDECFAANTIIETPNGRRHIQYLRVGDSIFSAAGKDKITNTFTKDIPLSRLIKVNISDGRFLFCSDSHEFYTNRGWIKSKNLLKDDLIFSFVRNIMQEIQLNQGDEYENRLLSGMQRRNAKIYKDKKDTKILQQKLCLFSSLSKVRKTLSLLWKTYNPIFETQEKIQQNLLQSELHCKGQINTRILSQEIIQCQNKKKDKSKTDKVFSNKRREERSSKKFSENVEKQPDAQSQNCRKNDNDTNKKGKFSSMERQTRGQWSIYKTTKKITGFIRNWLADGISNIYQTKITLSTQLQNRYRKQKNESRNRNRWKKSSHEEEYRKRYEKTKSSTILRVENIEIHKRGNNDQSFESVVGDRELRRDSITLYDIEVEKHPSYFANGILVHNCHKLTSDAQDEFFQMLEDGCPSHVYFIFTTTEPQKLKTPIKTRPKEITVKALNDKDLSKLLDNVCKKERIKIDEEVFDKIIENSNGSARKALVFLDSVINLKNKQEQLNSIVTASAEVQAFAIVKALLYNKKTTWKQMADVLKATEGEEPEQLRWLILACCKTEMLKAGHFTARAYVVIDAFRDNFYDSKMAGLAAACYECIEGSK